MNRKIEGVSNLIAITMAKARGDLEALGGLGKSLEELTFDVHDDLTIEEWGAAKELAERAQEHRIACLRVLGFLEPYVPSGKPSAALAGISLREPDEKPPTVRRRARPAGARKKVTHGHGRGSPDAATARQEKKA